MSVPIGINLGHADDTIESFVSRAFCRPARPHVDWIRLGDCRGTRRNRESVPWWSSRRRSVSGVVTSPCNGLRPDRWRGRLVVLDEQLLGFEGKVLDRKRTVGNPRWSRSRSLVEIRSCGLFPQAIDRRRSISRSDRMGNNWIDLRFGHWCLRHLGHQKRQ